VEEFDVLSVCCVQVLLCGMLGRWSHRLGLSPHTFTSSSAQPSSIGTSTPGDLLPSSPHLVAIHSYFLLSYLECLALLIGRMLLSTSYMYVVIHISHLVQLCESVSLSLSLSLSLCLSHSLASSPFSPLSF